MVLLVGAGCGGSAQSVATTPVVPATVELGGMPGPMSGASVPTLPVVTMTSVPTSEAIPVVLPPLVDDVRDHRLLLVGDSALVPTTSRADGTMCEFVTELGWDVDVEAEPGRSIGFADGVLDEVLDGQLDGQFDVVGLMFGNRVELSVDDFAQTLDEVLDRLGARAVILYTVAEVSDEQVEVNQIVRQRGRTRPNVVVVDWADAVAVEQDDPLTDGGPVPNEVGAERLAMLTADVLGDLETDEPGECVEPVFTDDSAIEL